MYFWVPFHRSKFLMVLLTLYVWFRQRLSNRQVTSHYLIEPMTTRFWSLYGVTRPQWVDSSWPSGAKWLNRSGSTLAEVMAHFLMALSHYLNQCSLIISEVLRHSTECYRVSQEILKISILDMNLKINNLRLQPHLPCANDSRYFWSADHERQSSLDVWRSHAVSTQYEPFQ